MPNNILSIFDAIGSIKKKKKELEAIDGPAVRSSPVAKPVPPRLTKQQQDEEQMRRDRNKAIDDFNKRSR